MDKKKMNETIWVVLVILLSMYLYFLNQTIKKPEKVQDSQSQTTKPLREIHASQKQVAALMYIIQANGYRCDTVDAVFPFTFSVGYTVYCNDLRYVFDVEDHGGKALVTVK